MFEITFVLPLSERGCPGTFGPITTTVVPTVNEAIYVNGKSYKVLAVYKDYQIGDSEKDRKVGLRVQLAKY